MASNVGMPAKILESALVGAIKLPWRMFRRGTRRALVQLLGADTPLQKYMATALFSADDFRKLTRKALVDLLVSDTDVQKYVATSQLSNEQVEHEAVVGAATKASLMPGADDEAAELTIEQSVHERIEKLLEARGQLIAVLERGAEPAPLEAIEAPVRYRNLGETDALVTVIVTLFNEENYIQDSIESLKRQTFAKFKAIIVDDASTNAARAKALDAISGDPRFRMVQHLKNGGVNAARNTGLRLADTHFVAFLDADDILLPDSIETRLNRFVEINDDLVAGVFHGLKPGPENITAAYAPPGRKWIGETQTFINARGQCPFGMHAPLLRTDALRRVGGFDENLRAGAEDWEMWQRILRCGYVFLPVNGVGGVYRQREGSRIRQAPRRHTEIGRSIIDAAYRELPEDGICEDAPYMLGKPLPYYQNKADFLPRFIRFASMAYMGGPDEFEWFCDDPPFEIWRHGKYGVDYKAQSKAGLIRFLALDGALAKQLDPLLNDVAEKILSELDAHVQKRLSAKARNKHDPRRPCASLFAHGAAQARVMADIAAQLREKGVEPVLVSLEMLAGDQGVEEFWTAAGVDFLSYNSYLLRGHARRSQVDIVMRPYGGAIRNCLGDGVVIEVVNPHGETSLPESNGPADADRVCALDDAAALAAEIVSGAAVSAATTTTALGPIGPAGAIVDIEERADGAADREKIQAFRDRFAGERCFILGNGPSLNAVDFDRLAGERVFAANGFFLKQRENGFQPTFYVVSDATVMRENCDDIGDTKSDYRIFSSLCKGLLPEDEKTIFYLLNRGFYEPRGEHFCTPRFSLDPATRIFCGQSVTLTSLQFAYHMGFSEVYLLGMDFHYEVPTKDIVKGELITSAGFDPNHFNGDYVSAGMTWKVPHLDRVKTAYEFARDTFESAGRRIYNATEGGRLEVFERVRVEDIAGPAKSSAVAGP